MRHLFSTGRSGSLLAVLLLPAWLASGCEDDSIRLGGWIQAPPAPAAPAAPPPAVPPAPPPPGGLAPPPAKPVPETMPVMVQALLKSRCETCHQYGQRDPSGWGSVMDLSRMIDSQIIVPGDLQRSRLWYRVAIRNDMPFNGSRLTPEEKTTLSDWIESLQRPLDRPRTQAEILDLLVQDQAAAGNAVDTRYISFAHLVDDRRPPEEIRAAAAVFRVALNSLSRVPGIVEPVAVDPEGSIWRFRLRDLGWRERDWSRLVSFDPYCLRSDIDRHQNLYQRLRTEAPIVRGDWFIASALRPPLYGDLLRLGDSLDEIARLELGIDINQNIAQGRVQRIASGGSSWTSPRVLERHAASGGGYLWLTYQLGPGEDVRRSPLGPRNRHNEFRASFTSVTTEAVWSLPNGLQAYLMADPDGNRIDAAPTAIVQDRRNRRDGSMETAIACNGCHGVSGLPRPQMVTDIPGYVQQRTMDYSPAEIDHIRRIYPANGEQILAADAGRYQGTIRGLLGDRLPVTDTGEWDDIVTLRGQYDSKVGLRQGALELGADLVTAERELRLSQTRGEPLLPLALTEPLVPRDDWICRYRQIARQARRASFCAGTFTAIELRSFCNDR